MAVENIQPKLIKRAQEGTKNLQIQALCTATKHTIIAPNIYQNGPNYNAFLDCYLIKLSVKPGMK